MDRYLAAHPDVFVAPQKESHHFATDFLLPSSPCLDPTVYATLFEGWSGEARVGESSVYYLMSETAAANIHAASAPTVGSGAALALAALLCAAHHASALLLAEVAGEVEDALDRGVVDHAACPDAKILAHLRHPVDLLYSHHHQLVYEGFQDVLDFEAALERGDDGRLADADARVHSNVHLARDYDRVVDFVPQLTRYFDTFGRDNVHVVLFDDLKGNPAGTYEDILEFLGVDSAFRVQFEVHNANKEVRSTRLRDMLRNPPSWLSLPTRLLLPLGMRNEIKRKVKRANTKYVERPPLSPDLRTRLTERFAPRVRDLEQLLGRNLSSWLPAGEKQPC